jgi:hypothetical protein
MEGSGSWFETCQARYYLARRARLTCQHMARPTLKKGCDRIRWVSQLMVPGWREWNEQLLNEYMYPHDVVEVLKIRLSERIQSNHIAWFYEKNGIHNKKRVQVSSEY